MTASQQLIIETWDRCGGEQSYEKIAEMLNLEARYVTKVIRSREEIEQSQWAGTKRKIPCLRCNTLFTSQGKYNRICESCKAYINKYYSLQETYSLGNIE